MIGYYKISTIGTDHLEHPDGVCQDHCDVFQTKNGYTIAVIADGLGSASRSDIGSKLAVNSVIEYIQNRICVGKDDNYYMQLLSDSYKAAYNSIISCAEKSNINIAEYNTTLTAALYDGKTLYYGQCGDGGIIVLTPGGDFECATEVKKGEAFNETFPLLGGEINWAFGKYDGEVCALTMMTDGIFDIVCHPLLAKEKQTINIPFIRRFMDRNILKANNEEDFIKLQNGVSSFISGDGLSGVTDDKTIVGLINTDITPALKEDEYYNEPDWEALKKKMNDILRKGLYKKSESDNSANAVTKKKSNNNDNNSIEIKNLNQVLERTKNRLANSITINKKLRKIVLAETVLIIFLIILLAVSFSDQNGDDKGDAAASSLSSNSHTDSSSNKGKKTKTKKSADNDAVTSKTESKNDQREAEPNNNNEDIAEE